LDSWDIDADGSVESNDSVESISLYKLLLMKKAKLEQVQSKGLIPRPEKDDDIFGGARLGLFTYPVLQAADILLYKFTLL
jgi:tryptophanyl-tRNA synthetase